MERISDLISRSNRLCPTSGSGSPWKFGVGDGPTFLCVDRLTIEPSARWGRWTRTKPTRVNEGRHGNAHDGEADSDADQRHGPDIGRRGCQHGDLYDLNVSRSVFENDLRPRMDRLEGIDLAEASASRLDKAEGVAPRQVESVRVIRDVNLVADSNRHIAITACPGGRVHRTAQHIAVRTARKSIMGWPQQGRI